MYYEANHIGFLVSRKIICLIKACENGHVCFVHSYMTFTLLPDNRTILISQFNLHLQWSLQEKITHHVNSILS